MIGYNIEYQNRIEYMLTLYTPMPVLIFLRGSRRGVRGGWVAGGGWACARVCICQNTLMYLGTDAL